MNERWTKLDGFKVRYLEAGQENKRHILFIHGLGSSADRWMKIPYELSSNFHTVAIDLLGFGESDKPSDIDYTIDRFRDFIISFLETVSMDDGKTSLVGHSLGGYIASEVSIQTQICSNNLS